MAIRSVDPEPEEDVMLDGDEREWREITAGLRESTGKLLAFLATLNVAILGGIGLLVAADRPLPLPTGRLGAAIALALASLIVAGLVYLAEHYLWLDTRRFHLTRLNARGQGRMLVPHPLWERMLEGAAQILSLLGPAAAFGLWVSASVCFGAGLNDLI